MGGRPRGRGGRGRGAGGLGVGVVCGSRRPEAAASCPCVGCVGAWRACAGVRVGQAAARVPSPSLLRLVLCRNHHNKCPDWMNR